MNFKLLKLITGELIISKIYGEKSKVITLENPLLVDISYNDELKPVFRYLPWQVIAEVKHVDINTSNVVYSTAPKSELLTVYMNICTQFDAAMRGGPTSPMAVKELENILNDQLVEQ